MSVLNTYVQQPEELKRYRLNYSRWLDATNSEIISTVATPVPTIVNGVEGDPEDLQVVVSQLLDDNQIVEYAVEGGIDGTVYDVEFTMTSSLGQITQDKVRFRIIDL